MTSSHDVTVTHPDGTDLDRHDHEPHELDLIPKLSAAHSYNGSLFCSTLSLAHPPPVGVSVSLKSKSFYGDETSNVEFVVPSPHQIDSLLGGEKAV